MRAMACIAASALVVVVASGACATKKESEMPGVVAADVIEFESTVEAVDAQKRRVTLKGPDGATRTFALGRDVRNFDQIKPGDKVKVELIEEVALFVRKASEPPTAVAATAVGVAPKGQKPGLVTVDTVQISGNVEAIDYQKRMITLRGPQGNLVTYKVDESAKRFSDVKKGEQVVMQITEALAIVVTKP
jgi:Cu/Ag efflux protein CusF